MSTRTLVQISETKNACKTVERFYRLLFSGSCEKNTSRGLDSLKNEFFTKVVETHSSYFQVTSLSQEQEFLSYLALLRRRANVPIMALNDVSTRQLLKGNCTSVTFWTSYRDWRARPPSQAGMMP